jgi:hypothetical protein
MAVNQIQSEDSVTIRQRGATLHPIRPDDKSDFSPQVRALELRAARNQHGKALSKPFYPSSRATC